MMNLMKGLALLLACFAIVLFALVMDAQAETCSTSSEMDAATKAALQRTAEQDFTYVAQGNSQALAQNSIPEIASNVQGLEGVLQQHKANLAGATSSSRNVYLLDTGGTAPLERAEFFCGVFNAGDKTGFTLQNLPGGKYGLVILNVQNSKVPYFFSFLLRQDGQTWKIAGLFPHNRQIAGHDAQWYWGKAREFKAKGELHNAWFYYLAARELAAPLPFMGTSKLDSFYDEVQQSQPSDLPEKTPVPVTGANGKTYQITSLFVVPDEKGQGLDLVMKYQTPDISDSGKTFLENKEAMKALLNKYPEFREIAGNLVARAVAPSGQDFGSELPIKDIK
jgi:hypothetical protein